MAKDSSRNIVLVIVGVAALGCLACSGGLWLLGGYFGDITNPRFSAGGIAERDVPRLFGVTLPARPVHLRGRQAGFQDPIFDVLVHLPKGTREAFLSANGLTVGGPPLEDLTEPEAELRRLQPGVKKLDAQALNGFRDLEADGGYVELFRHGSLIDADGETWLYLVAFGT